jgi:hypothetical protein
MPGMMLAVNSFSWRCLAPATWRFEVMQDGGRNPWVRPGSPRKTQTAADLVQKRAAEEAAHDDEDKNVSEYNLRITIGGVERFDQEELAAGSQRRNRLARCRVEPGATSVEMCDDGRAHRGSENLVMCSAIFAEAVAVSSAVKNLPIWLAM